jgi:leucyl aminopeptidase
MNYSAKSSNPLNQATGCLVVSVFADKSLSEVAKSVDEASGGMIRAALKRGDIKGKAGDCLLFPAVPGTKAERLVVLGCGDPGKELSRGDIAKLGENLAQTFKKATCSDATISALGLKLADDSYADCVSAMVESLERQSYSFDQLKRKKSPVKLKTVRIHGVDRSAAKTVKQGIDQGVAIANGVKSARDLGNLPGNICTPTYLANQARKLGKSHALKVTVLNEARMEKLGMGSLLSVSRGSREPAHLIVMEYNGAPKSQAPVVLVGKGLTFDAGGISLKPAGAMDEMKYDMCGGASVFGTMQAVAEMKLPVNLVGIVPASENLPDGAANKPGDIVTAMDGQTIEILNTDAEGRLILCDALTYARRYKPAAIVDIATLTGACVVALGAPASGMFSHSDELCAQLSDAGDQSGDRVWRLPLWDDYQSLIDSPFADIANVGGRTAGAVTAACFLARFTKDLNWAHLDIAGSAWSSGKNKSSTGRPVGLLTRFVMNHCQS